MNTLGNRTRILATSLVAAATLALSLATVSGSALASSGVCRSDPVITLSNGKTVTLYENISDISTDVTGGVYVLHGPSGTSVSRTSWSGTLGSQQSLSYYADQRPGNYNASSTVLTKTSGHAVTAYMTVGSNQSTSANGYSNKAIYNSDYSR